MKLARDTIKRTGRRAAASTRLAKKVREGRSPGVNHTNIDPAAEHEADWAADMVVRGQPNAAKVITPAPAARYDEPASAAEALPDAVKTEMEESFGADFGGVRIHRDAVARAAAEREQAQAFTAGRDIYFGEGKYEPDGDEGKRLLAHELAHVLQQTGQRISSTMIRATERVGDGPIQLQPVTEPSFVAPLRRYGFELSRLRAASTEPPDHDDDDDERER